MANSKVEEILDAIGGLTVLEAAELKKAMEDKFGVSAAMPVAMGAAAPAAAEAEEEKDEFDVVLSEIGGKKIQVIKALREVTSLGLKEAKELVDGAPTTIREGVPKEEAERMKAALEEQGATVELK